MTLRFLTILIVCLTCTVFSCAAQPADSPQSIQPMIVNGVVTVNGNPVPVGTKITAVRDNIQVAQMPVALDGSYALLIKGDRDDIEKAVEFFVNNIKVDYTTVWTPGQVERLDISIKIALRELPGDNAASDLVSTGVSGETTSPTGRITEGQILDLSLVYPLVIVVVLLGFLYYLRSRP